MTKNGILGLNGFNEIGRLTVWYHVAHKNFDEIVVNIDRQVGTSISDIVHSVVSVYSENP